MSFFSSMTRRALLKLPAIIPLSIWARQTRSGEYHFHYDHVIGTSLDMVVWTQNPTLAEEAHQTVLREIQRLARILNTRDPDSEISRLESDPGGQRSSEMQKVLSAYAAWEQRTQGILSIRPLGPTTPRNVDALGKAYIIDAAARAARQTGSGIDGVLVNIGGDIVSSGRACEIGVADPQAPYDNAEPFTRVLLQNRAIATSGSYARGAHLVDARDGRPSQGAFAATVIAPDAVAANALATTLCVTGPEGLGLVESTPGSEALLIAANGNAWRTSRFSRLEQPRVILTTAVADWPPNYQLTISLTLTEGTGNNFGRRGGFGGFPGGRGGGRGGAQRQYVAVWVENPAGKLIRVLAFWASKPRYYSELSTFWRLTGGNQNYLYSVARATRPPGKYDLVWDGLDDQRKPAAPGAYRIVVETAQEHGNYGKQSGSIDCGDNPASITLPASANFETVTIQYGPKTGQA